jgi:hypothetical protein
MNKKLDKVLTLFENNSPNNSENLPLWISLKANKWARQVSNLRPSGYEPPALTTELRAPSEGDYNMDNNFSNTAGYEMVPNL